MPLLALRTTSGLLPRIFLVPVAAFVLTRPSGASRPFCAAPWDSRRERENLTATSWRGRELRSPRVSVLRWPGQEMETGLVEEAVAQAEATASATKKKPFGANSEDEGENRPDSGSGRRIPDFDNPERFELTPTVTLVLQGGDITEWSVDGNKDAIVNAANELLLGGGGVDGAIHQAAGRELYFACKDVPCVAPGVRCPTGEAVLTDAFDLAVAKVIHTVGPTYSMSRAPELLAKAYENSVKKALDAGLEYVSFPAISCGAYGYPPEEAVEVALDSLQKHSEGLREVHFVLFDEAARRAWFGAARERLMTRHED